MIGCPEKFKPDVLKRGFNNSKFYQECTQVVQAPLGTVNVTLRISVIVTICMGM